MDGDGPGGAFERPPAATPGLFTRGRHAEILSQTEHRPWPLPSRGWAFWQSWQKLLFAHWPVDAEVLRALIPAPLELDLHDGRAWIGIVPFELSIRPKFLPVVPRLGRFPEINVRTYVRHGDRQGVWFFSLDARQPVACWGARTFFHLPYYWASMRMRRQGDLHRYWSKRHYDGGEFLGSYRPLEALDIPPPGSLLHFLTERYALFAQNPKGEVLTADVHHAPWPLHAAECEIETNTLTKNIGLELEGPPVHLHYAERVDVYGWPIRVSIGA